MRTIGDFLKRVMGKEIHGIEDDSGYIGFSSQLGLCDAYRSFYRILLS